MSFKTTFDTHFETPCWNKICPRSNKMSPREPSGASKTKKQPFQNHYKTLCFYTFLGPEASQESLKRPKKASKRHPKSSKTSKTGSKNGPQNSKFLDKFLDNFGSHFWIQNSLKRGPKMGPIFEPILGSPRWPRTAGISQGRRNALGSWERIQSIFDRLGQTEKDELDKRVLTRRPG